MPCVDAVHVGGWVGFGVAQRLRLFQHIVIIETLTGHVVENIVAGAVHDAADLPDALHPAGAFQLGKPADAAAHGCCAAEADTLFLHQRQQLVIEGAYQRLVGSYHIFPRLNGGADIVVSRVQPAHDLHHGVDAVVLHNVPDVPDGLRVWKLHILPTQNLDDLHIVSAPGKLIHAPADDTEAQQSDLHQIIPRFVCMCGDFWSVCKNGCVHPENTCFLSENSISYTCSNFNHAKKPRFSRYSQTFCAISR